MSQLGDVQNFIELSRRAHSPADLDNLMQAVSRDMGFDYFALIHHVDLSAFRSELSHMDTGQLIALSNYPSSWIEQYLTDDLVTNDPVLLASQRTNVGFAWDEIPNMIAMTAEHRKITERTRNAGIENGFTVPAHVPGEANGSCNFAMRTGHALPTANLPMAQVVGAFAFQAARDIVDRARAAAIGPKVALTQRQLECISLIARGKTDWEISRILNISEETVREHVKDARQRYDVPKRVQLVLRAIYDGHLSLRDVVR